MRTLGNEEDLNKGNSSDSSEDSKAEDGTTGDAEKSSSESTAETAAGAPGEASPASEASEPADAESEAKPADDGGAIIDRPQGSREDRHNMWVSCLKTFEYIGEISSDKNLTFRSSDKLTTRLLVIALVGAVVFAFMPAFNLPVAAAAFYVTADIVLMAAIIVFVVARIGIIRAMEPRYALVCWHLMVGTALLFLTIGFNVLAGIVLFLMRDQLQLLIGGG